MNQAELLLNFKEGRPERHLRDIGGILAVSGDVIDAGYVEAWSQRLGLGEIWAAIRRRTGGASETPPKS